MTAIRPPGDQLISPRSTSPRQPGAARARRAAAAAQIPYINRELSWLEFNDRVLFEAVDERNPLLERVRFLAIFASNLDEFFQVRVAGLKQQVEAGSSSPTPDGMSAAQALDAIRTRLLPMVARHSETFAAVRDELAEEEHPHRRLRRAAGAPPRAAGALLRRDLPGADAARGRSRPPVPVHQRPVAVARGDGPRPGQRGAALRADQGAADPAAADGSRRRTPTSCSSRSSPPTSTRSSRAWRSSSTTCSE